MKKITKYIIVGMVVSMALTSVGCYGRQYYLQQQLAEKIIRFHVLANSDSEADQTLKLQVRDVVGSYMQEKMQNISSKTECEGLLAEWMPEIEYVANQAILEEGFSYRADVELTECAFPVKTYGNYTFPAGTYEALRVTIGEGKGQNWWCVMYPNMCFENSMYEVVDEKSEEALRKVLDEEEYQAVLNSGNYQIRFRIWDILSENMDLRK
ncbi:MAG: stage II sporulation protein R [Roseburia sp.]|nr:stage II sporulation protein R [Roseburia sp.]